MVAEQLQRRGIRDPNVLRAIEKGGKFARDPVDYQFSIFGTPGAKDAWGWRVEGHHLSLHFTIAGGATVATSPTFTGANPAEVRDGPRKGTRVLALWANDTAVLITRKQAIKSLADAKGLKIRAPSAVAAEFIKSWGATPVNIPVDGVYQAMDTGVVDGVYIGASGIRSFRLHEVGGHLTAGLPASISAFFLVMNEAKWNALSAEQKGWLESVSGRALSLKAAEAYRRDGEAGLKLFAEKK